MLDSYRKYNVFSFFLGILFLVSSWFSPLASAQTWPWVTSISGNGSETFSALTTRTNDGPVVCGHFQNDLSIGDLSEQSFGNTDAFLAGLDGSGEEQWILTGNSAGANKSTGVATDLENNIYWAGEF